MWVTVRAVLLTSFKAIGAVTLGGGIFWHVATHCGPQYGDAYVHVLAADVEVHVDSETRYVETPLEPALVFELKPGRHTLQMARHGQTLYREAFTIARGKSVILMPFEQPIPSRTNALNKTNRAPNKFMEGMRHLETVMSGNTQ